jgi:hypothetical protein
MSPHRKKTIVQMPKRGKRRIAEYPM